MVAGATDLAVEANLRGRRWPMLVSVEARAGIARVSRYRRTRSRSARA